jgi:metal-responsive CopG/Arc/MetJ family transcriptional regulator
VAIKEPTENISVTMPINLLSILDNFCHESDLNRSQAVCRAVRLYIGTKIARTPAFWQEQYQKLQEQGKI